MIVSLFAALGILLIGKKDPGGRPWLTILCLVWLLLLPGLALLPKYQVELAGDLIASRTDQWVVASWCFTAWVLGTLLMLVRLVVRHYLLWNWLKESALPESLTWDVLLENSLVRLGLRNRPKIVFKEGLTSPVVAGLLRPVIVFPKGADVWSSDTKEMALLHELGHVQRKDLWVRVAADLACVIHWYNPLVWWLRSKLLSQCEYACDAHVVASGVDRGVYVHALCEVIEHAREYRSVPAGVCAMANHHAPLRLRAERLLEGTSNHRSWFAVMIAVGITSCALGLTVIKPVDISLKFEETGIVPVYSQQEIELRHRANPFPGN